MPHIVSKSGSTKWTRCISRSVAVFRTSGPPPPSSRNCHEAKRARSSAVEAKPIAGATPFPMKNLTASRRPARVSALYPVARRLPRSASGISGVVDASFRGTRMFFET